MTGDAPRSPRTDAAPSTGAAAVWSLGDRTLDYGRRPLIMGILNVTPDSFHAASRHDADSIAEAAVAMAAAGADVLDLGAESTRPGAEPVPADEELVRLLPAVRAVRAAVDLPLTVDTRRAAVAAAALDAGADGINDVSAGEDDPDLLPTAAEHGAGLVLMHKRGVPASMQDDPRYDDVVADVAAYLNDRVVAAAAAGVARERVLIDPGIGFGKTLEHNLRLLGSLRRLADVAPVMLGASRKSFIAALYDAPPSARLGGSLAAAALAHEAGCAAVRVHDAADTRQLFDVLSAVKNPDEDGRIRR